MVVCLCKGISARQIKEFRESGCKTVGEVGKKCFAGTDCGACVVQISSLLRNEGGKS